MLQIVRNNFGIRREDGRHPSGQTSKTYRHLLHTRQRMRLPSRVPPKSMSARLEPRAIPTSSSKCALRPADPAQVHPYLNDGRQGSARKISPPSTRCWSAPCVTISITSCNARQSANFTPVRTTSRRGWRPEAQGLEPFEQKLLAAWPARPPKASPGASSANPGFGETAFPSRTPPALLARLCFGLLKRHHPAIFLCGLLIQPAEGSTRRRC